MRCIVLVTKVKAISPVPTCLSISNVRTQVDALSSKIYFLLLVQVMSVLVCSFVLMSKAWLLMRLKVPSITASSFFSASTTACTIRCSSQSISLHRSPRCEELPLLGCVSHAFINQAVHLWSQTNELRDAMSVVFILEDGTRQLFVEVEERFQ